MVSSFISEEDFNQFDLERCQLSALDLQNRGSAKWAERTWKNQPLLGAWIAEMDFGSAPAVEVALCNAIANGFFGYLPTWLETDLKQAFADWQKHRYQWEISNEQVFLLPDVLSALKAMIKLYTKPGDAIIVPTPSYMPFLTIPKQLGRQVIEVPSFPDETGRWEMNWAGLEAVFKGEHPLLQSGETAAPIVILCNPHNPTGRVFTETELRRFGKLALTHQKMVFNDEIHAPLVGGPQQHLSFARLDSEFAKITVTASAASKGWNVAGLKCAQMVLTDEKLIANFHDSGQLHELAEGVAPLGALAAVAAYTEGERWLDEALSYLHGNALEMHQLLTVAAPQVHATIPEGTYLSLWDASPAAHHAEKLGFDEPVDWMAAAGVAVNGGTALGSDWPWLIRFNLATPRPLVRQMVQRCSEALNPL